MEKLLSALMQKNVISVNVDDAVAIVERILITHKLSCVPVMDDHGSCFGIISASDVISIHQDNRKMLAEKAWELCNHKVIAVGPATTVKEAAELMVRKKVHHLLVMSDQKVLGIVSALDLISSMNNSMGEQSNFMSEQLALDEEKKAGPYRP